MFPRLWQTKSICSTPSSPLITLARHSACSSIERRVLGPQHPQTLLSLMSLGALYHDTGKLEQAEEAYQLFDRQTSGKGVFLPS